MDEELKQLDVTERLSSLMPDGDGYNSDYAHTLQDAIDTINELRTDLQSSRDTLKFNEGCWRKEREAAIDKIQGLRAQLPSQGGEAVEVVAWANPADLIQDGYSHSFGVSSEEYAGREPLMTVAQHQRILAAATHPADQVAEGVVVSRELLELLCEMVDLHDRRGAVLTVHMEHLRALLAKSEGVKK